MWGTWAASCWAAKYSHCVRTLYRSDLFCLLQYEICVRNVINLELNWQIHYSTDLQTGGKNFEKRLRMLKLCSGRLNNPSSSKTTDSGSRLLPNISQSNLPWTSTGYVSGKLPGIKTHIGPESLTIAKDRGSGICTKLWIKTNALLINTKAVDVLGGKFVENSRGQGVMFWG